MSFNLQQAPDRYRKTLYRSDHFWVDSRNVSKTEQPRYKDSAFSSDADKLTHSNEEAVLSISLDGSTPYRDVFIGSPNTHLYVNGVGQVNDLTAAGQIVPTSNSGSATTTDIPVWYSNCQEFTGGVYYTYKTKWCQSYRPASGSVQNSEMREPIGLSKMMLFYRRCTPYRKKFRITFYPTQTNRIRAALSGTPAQGFAISGSNTSDVYDPPFFTRGYFASQSAAYTSWGGPNMKMVIGGFEATTPQVAGKVPFWISGKTYPIPIKQSQEGMKIGVFQYKAMNTKPIVMEYTVSIESTYGKKVDMAEVYYTNSGVDWQAVNAYPTYVNMFMYTLENSVDAAFVPHIEGLVRIESWVDCLFWDRKQVDVAFGLATEEVGEAATNIEDNTEQLELEVAD